MSLEISAIMSVEHVWNCRTKVHETARACFPYASQESTWEMGSNQTGSRGNEIDNRCRGRLALPPGKGDHIEWDETLPGFGVRLRGRSKGWVVQYRVGRQQRRESLGDVRKVKP